MGVGRSYVSIWGFFWLVVMTRGYGVNWCENRILAARRGVFDQTGVMFFRVRSLSQLFSLWWFPGFLVWKVQFLGLDCWLELFGNGTWSFTFALETYAVVKICWWKQDFPSLLMENLDNNLIVYHLLSSLSTTTRSYESETSLNHLKSFLKSMLINMFLLYLNKRSEEHTS